MTGACGPYNLGGSATLGLQALPLSLQLSAVQGPPNPKTTKTVGLEKSWIYDKRATSLPSAHNQVCARDNKSVTCLESYATVGP